MVTLDNAYIYHLVIKKFVIQYLLHITCYILPNFYCYCKDISLQARVSKFSFAKQMQKKGMTNVFSAIQ